jgi:exodeoxyribonuclease III
MKIASWNVNSLKARLPHLSQWLADAQPDVVALQETKLEDAKFPVDELAAAGYRAVYSGQKTYNGVAILARGEPRDIVTDIPGLADPQRRILAASIGAPGSSPGQALRVVNLYVVNGKAVGDEKYAYKLSWSVTPIWWCWAISTSARMIVMCTIRSRGARTSYARRRNAPASRRSPISACMTASGCSKPALNTTAGGTTGRRRSVATWACASI